MFTVHAAILVAALTYVVLSPFHGLVGAPADGGIGLDLSSIFALWVYALLAWGSGWRVRVPALSPAPVAGWHHPVGADGNDDRRRV
jgi:hypothetical protein